MHRVLLVVHSYLLPVLRKKETCSGVPEGKLDFNLDDTFQFLESVGVSLSSTVALKLAALDRLRAEIHTRLQPLQLVPSW